MKVTPTSGLTGEEIERLIAEASASAEADRRMKDVIHLRSRLESLVRNTHRAYRELGSSLLPEERQAGQAILMEAEGVLKSDSDEEIRRVQEAVERLASQLATAMLNAPADGAGKHGETSIQEPEEPNSRL
jgi:molecular chaperone DnaK